MTLHLYNTPTRRKDSFTPIDSANVRMYVCGPTVYDRPHLGNARSVVVYDVLYRLLQHSYGENHVTYVRNITDVDDKINAAAIANGEPISALTGRVEQWFHDDIAALGCLNPTHEPRATEHIAHMVAMIEKLISGNYAYVAQGHVLFSVMSYKDYGALSNRKLDDLIAGSRVEVEAYKRHAGDFVLWKPANEGDDTSSVFDSPWGKGRPGWHIECSAMSSEYLGGDFDIHGGGADLMFPHHENEIAQSCCAAPGSKFANVWVHNGFLTVNGEKMSKSLGNFTTVKDLLDKGVKGEVIRLALLSTHYKSPLDWTEKLIEDSQKQLDYFYRIIQQADMEKGAKDLNARREHYFGTVSAQMSALYDDLNTSRLLACIDFSKMEKYENLEQKITFGTYKVEDKNNLKAAIIKYYGNLIGILQQTPEQWFKGEGDDAGIWSHINARAEAKKAKNWAEADAIRKALAGQGILLEDKPDGTTDWRRA